MAGERITLEAAKEYVGRYRSNPLGTPIKAWKFDKSIYADILAQEGCMGVRSYLGRTEVGDVTLVLVGVDASGRDMTDGVLAERALPCPPFCPESPLVE